MLFASFGFRRNDWTRRLLTTAPLGSRDGRPVSSRETPARCSRVALAASVSHASARGGIRPPPVQRCTTACHYLSRDSPTIRSAGSDYKILAQCARACREERRGHITCFFGELRVFLQKIPQSQKLTCAANTSHSNKVTDFQPKSGDNSLIFLRSSKTGVDHHAA